MRPSAALTAALSLLAPTLALAQMPVADDVESTSTFTVTMTLSRVVATATVTTSSSSSSSSSSYYYPTNSTSYVQPTASASSGYTSVIVANTTYVPPPSYVSPSPKATFTGGAGSLVSSAGLALAAGAAAYLGAGLL